MMRKSMSSPSWTRRAACSSAVWTAAYSCSSSIAAGVWCAQGTSERAIGVLALKVFRRSFAVPSKTRPCYLKTRHSLSSSRSSSSSSSTFVSHFCPSPRDVE
uniref:Uncharacterized protein n=1 Tax=Hemiselmis andersenii TaxID=464988 RepID=A0A6U5BV58_HEMAN